MCDNAGKSSINCLLNAIWLLSCFAVYFVESKILACCTIFQAGNFRSILAFKKSSVLFRTAKDFVPGFYKNTFGFALAALVIMALVFLSLLVNFFSRSSDNDSKLNRNPCRTCVLPTRLFFELMFNISVG